MTRNLSRLGVALAAVMALAAFAPQESKPDPVTGKWSGALIPEEADSRSVVFELKYDGKQQVSGSFTGLNVPGDVRSGTFDAKTGALHLGLSQQGEQEVLITLEGKVADGVISGTMEGQKVGRFRLERQAPAR